MNRIEDRISRNYEYAGEIYDFEALKYSSEIAEEKENDIKNVLKIKFNSFVFQGKVFGLRKKQSKKKLTTLLETTYEVLQIFNRILGVIALSILPLCSILSTIFILYGLLQINIQTLFSSLCYIALAPCILFYIYKVLR